jgi:hypothetical protein
VNCIGQTSTPASAALPITAIAAIADDSLVADPDGPILVTLWQRVAREAPENLALELRDGAAAIQKRTASRRPWLTAT